MKPQTIGEITVSRVVEMEGFLFTDGPKWFEKADSEAFRAEKDWLAPYFYDMAQDTMIMSIHSFVVQTPHHTILVDTCCGNDKNRPSRQAQHMLDTPFLDDLRATGVAPEEIDFVMCTHLHFDHVGWNTRLQDGEWVPTFPNAKYLFSRADYEHFQSMPEAGTSAALSSAADNSFLSYRDSVLPVVEAGQAVIIETDHALDDTVWVEPAPGHTPGNFAIHVASQGRDAVFSGDIMHHPIQLAHPDWASRACIDKDMANASRRSFLDKYAETDVAVFAAHFATPTAGRIVAGKEEFRFQVTD